MKLWQKLIVVVLTSGLSAGCTFAAGAWTTWAMPLGYLSLAVAAVGTTLTGFVPTKSA